MSDCPVCGGVVLSWEAHRKWCVQRATYNEAERRTGESGGSNFHKVKDRLRDQVDDAYYDSLRRMQQYNH